LLKEAVPPKGRFEIVATMVSEGFPIQVSCRVLDVPSRATTGGDHASRRRVRCGNQALHAVIMQAYVEGVSTRSVDDLVQALGIDSGISKSEVSRICARLDVEVDAFRNRILAHVEFPYQGAEKPLIGARVLVRD
jgi:hypothetical protein